MSFGHEGPGQQAGGGGEYGGDQDGGVEAGQRGGDAADQGADGVAGVAPEPVDAQGGGPPVGVGGVADHGEQAGIDQGGAGAEEEGAGQARGQGVGDADRDNGQADGLDEHAGYGGGLAADPVGEVSGGDHPGGPHERIQGLDVADAGDRDAVADQQDRQHDPDQAVVEVVDQPGLADRGQGAVGPRDPPGDVAERGPRPGLAGVLAGLGAGPGGGVADRERRQGQAGGGVAHAEQFGGRAQPEPGGQVACCFNGAATTEIAG